MRAYRCRVCDNPLYFENSVCVSCGTALGYSRSERAIVPVGEDGRYVDAAGLVWHVCRNLNLHGCTWLAATEGGQCFSCDLTRTRPSDADLVGLENYPAAERAKRHLIVELDTLGFPVTGKDPATGGDPVNGLAFDLLSSVAENVVIGHQDGVITIDLAESDDAYREQVKQKLAEPYRTMLGHFRHEVGHYFEWQLVRGPELIGRCRELFGDENADYQSAIERHYREGPPEGWESSYLSTYATMHPFEDFAETWAHYLHISDTVETASEYGLAAVAPVTAFSSFRDVVSGIWVPLSIALNMINRSMGKADLYPFVIPGPVLDKLDFVASLRP
ncbi:MAG TPA: putative zinc-binding metallopeptidase [Nocardioides sp.]|uniref:zinc-binding metallopeptidase family protein n=1 Tax=uncultured Nocardioides sp. TaxID=198441 RepID=UPI002620C716|nr:putative zinc-binding metallopeptidase [uncultured Nocardioides sp.]HRD60633.1 putative zinc-binding metallopeptidase [Nocardioides sp.]HRI95423.1 putative zinc-binding metallopeptidase [Nocardioides sp.]HRK45324.1 putative zinc-binding metallopeptidase [Nocardioides sp.]